MTRRRAVAAGEIYDVVHASSAHPWTDNRVHLREAASLAANGRRVLLVAIQTDSEAASTGVHVRTVPRRGRLARLLLSSAQVIWIAVRSGAPIVHLHDPELIPYIPVLKVLRRRVIYDAHEHLFSQLSDKPYLPRRLQSPMRAAARSLVAISRHADVIIAATEAIAELYPEDRTTVVRNYPRLLVTEHDLQSVRDRKPIAVYVGALSEGRGALQMIDALADPHFPSSWGLSIAGVSTEALRQRLRESDGWDRVTDHGSVSPSEARALIGGSRVGLAVLQRTPAYLESLPTKMFEYFAAGVPVIASDFPLWREIVERHDCGLIVDESDPESIARAVKRYATEPELLDRHSANARRAALEEFRWEKEERALLRVYSDLGG